jgi:hypothetical protein
MAEGRITQVVSQTGTGHYGAEFLDQRASQLGVTTYDIASHIVAQRHAYACHLKGMGKTVMNEDRPR